LPSVAVFLLRQEHQANQGPFNWMPTDQPGSLDEGEKIARRWRLGEISGSGLTGLDENDFT
jgi:hypothetical protein